LRKKTAEKEKKKVSKKKQAKERMKSGGSGM